MRPDERKRRSHQGFLKIRYHRRVAGAIPNRARASDHELNWPRMFLIISLVFGLPLAVLLRPARGMDELLHIYRVDTISQGWLVPPLHGVTPNDYRIHGCVKSFALTTLVLPKSSAFHNTPCDAPSSARGFGNSIARAELWSPVPYLPTVLGYRLGLALHGAVGALLLGRIFQLLSFIGLMYAAIRAAPWGKPFLFTIGLLPVVLGGAAGISADPLSTAFAILALCLVLRLINKATAAPTTAFAQPVASAKDLLVLGTVLVCSGLSKSVYAPLSIMVLAIPTAGFGTLRRRVRATIMLLVATAIAAGAWIFGVVLRIAPTAGSAITGPATALAIRHHPMTFLSAILRTWLHSSDTRNVVGGLIIPVYRLGGAPNITLWFLMIALVILVIIRLLDPTPFRRWHDRGQPPGMAQSQETPGSDLDGTAIHSWQSTPSAHITAAAEVAKRDRTIAIMVAVVASASCFLLIEYGIATSAPLGWPQYIFGVQGRYFIPLLPLLLFGVNGSRYVKPERRLVIWIPVASTLMLLWWTIISLRHVNHWL